VFVDSHSHPQFILQVTHYVPLKEVLWYAQNWYPAYFFAHQLGLSPTAEAMAVALLAQLVNIPYECTGPRQGIHLVSYHPNFQYANTNVTWMEAPVINVLGNLIMPTFVALIVRHLLATKRGFLPTVALIGFCFPLAVVFFAPVSMMKFCGCTHLDMPSDLFSFSKWWDWYIKCVTSSNVTETAIWSTFLTVYTCRVLLELLDVKRHHYPYLFGDREANPGILSIVPSAQSVEYLLLFIIFHESDLDYYPSLIMYLNILFINLAVGTFITRRMASSIGTSKHKKKRN